MTSAIPCHACFGLVTAEVLANGCGIFGCPWEPMPTPEPQSYVTTNTVHNQPCWCCGELVSDYAGNPNRWSSRIAREGIIHTICLECASKLQTAEAIVLRVGSKLMQMRKDKQLTQEEFDRVYAGLRAEFLSPDDEIVRPDHPGSLG